MVANSSAKDGGAAKKKGAPMKPLPHARLTGEDLDAIRAQIEGEGAALKKAMEGLKATEIQKGHPTFITGLEKVGGNTADPKIPNGHANRPASARQESVSSTGHPQKQSSRPQSAHPASNRTTGVSSLKQQQQQQKQHNLHINEEVEDASGHGYSGHGVIMQEGDDKDEDEDRDLEADEAVLRELSTMMADLASSVGVRTAQRLMQQAFAGLERLPGAYKGTMRAGNPREKGEGDEEGEDDAREEAEELERLLLEEEEKHASSKQENKALAQQVVLLTEQVVSLEKKARESKSESCRGSGGVELEAKVARLQAMVEEEAARVKRRERDCVEAREAMSAVKSQLRDAVEARECVEEELRALREMYGQQKGAVAAALEEAKRACASEKVLRRNAGGGMVEEIGRLERMVRELEEDKRRRVGGGGSELEVEGLLEEARRERDEVERRWGVERADLEERLRQAESSLKATARRKGEQGMGGAERRAAASVRLSADTANAAVLKRRSMELLAQNHALEEAKEIAEHAAREAMSRCKVLQEKLSLVGSVRGIEVSKEDAKTESDVDRLFSTPRAPTSRPSSAGGGAGTPRGRPPPTGVGGGTLSVRGMPQTASLSGAKRASSEGRDTFVPVATKGRGDSLIEMVRELEGRVKVEESSRIAAQETLVMIASQLADRDDELEALRQRRGS